MLYRPAFDATYEKFWKCRADPEKVVDLRGLALIFIVLSFGVLLDYDPSSLQSGRDYVRYLDEQGHDIQPIRGLIDELELKTDTLGEREVKSRNWEWAASYAMSQRGRHQLESVDLVRANLLVSHSLSRS